MILLQKFCRFTLAIVVIFIPIASNLLAQEVSHLRVGFGRTDITPKRPTPMAGYYHVRLSEDWHDPLWSRATVLSDGDKTAALIHLDLIATTKWLVRESRQLIESRTGIPADHVMISASHSHTGPVLSDPDEGRQRSLGGDRDEAKRYMSELPVMIVSSVELALSNLHDSTLQVAIGSEPFLGFNRRFFMKDGSVGWNPGKLNPNIVRPAGPTDDSLPLILFSDSESEQPLGVHANFAIHLDTVGGTAWSADAPFTMEQCLQRVFGDQFHVQYTTGCCGDINHLDVSHARPQKGHGEAARIGTRLAASMLRSLNDFTSAEGTSLHVTTEQILLPARETPQDRIAWAKEIAVKAAAPQQPPFLEMVEAFRILDTHERNEQPIQVEVQVITLGREIAWISLPGEIFVQLGLAIKDGSPFRINMINELANGSVGYIPTQQAYGQGHYEVISARVAEGSGEMLVASALRQLKSHFAMKP